MDNKIADAVGVLIDELLVDEPYRYSWKCNIAMGFQDVASQLHPEYDPQHMHDIANAGAEYFLRLLTYKGQDNLPGSFSLAKLVHDSIESE